MNLADHTKLPQLHFAASEIGNPTVRAAVARFALATNSLIAFPGSGARLTFRRDASAARTALAGVLKSEGVSASGDDVLTSSTQQENDRG